MHRRNLFKLLASLPFGTALANTAPRNPAQGENTTQGMADIIPELLTELSGRHKNGLIGLSTGYADMDRMTHGLRKGELTVIAARPSMGKTNLALNIAENVALCSMDPRPVGFFSMDMAAEQLTMRMVSSLSETKIGLLKSGRFGDEDWPRIASASQILAEAPLYIDDTPALTITELNAKARQLKSQQPNLSLIVIDYLQLMQTRPAGDQVAKELASISHSLKSLAIELDIPIIVLSQLNRDVEKRSNKRPLISDLRGSTPIEKHADLIMFIYRDEIYNDDSPNKGEAEILVAKNRHGDSGAFVLTFEGQHSRFGHYIPNFFSGRNTG